LAVAGADKRTRLLASHALGMGAVSVTIACQRAISASSLSGRSSTILPRPR